VFLFYGLIYLGFLIPTTIVLRNYKRDSLPRKGICVYHGVGLLYEAGDGTRVCESCIRIALRETPDDRPQHRPMSDPIEHLVALNPDPIPDLYEKAFGG